MQVNEETGPSDPQLLRSNLNSALQKEIAASYLKQGAKKADLKRAKGPSTYNDSSNSVFKVSSSLTNSARNVKLSIGSQPVSKQVDQDDDIIEERSESNLSRSKSPVQVLYERIPYKKNPNST